MFGAGQSGKQMGRDSRWSVEARCVSHQLGFKAFRTRLRNSHHGEEERHQPGRWVAIGACRAKTLFFIGPLVTGPEREYCELS
jgi:hypothetical protein